jgi:hypothetical protein
MQPRRRASSGMSRWDSSGKVVYSYCCHDCILVLVF